MTAEPMTEGELTEAFVRALPPGGPQGPSARRALERLTGPARESDAALAAAWAAAAHGRPDRLADLAGVLHRHVEGGAAGELRAGLREWVREYAPAGAGRAPGGDAAGGTAGEAAGRGVGDAVGRPGGRGADHLAARTAAEAAGHGGGDADGIRAPDTAPTADRSAGHSNTLAGHTLVAGSSVQARDIHGGVHLHHAAPSPRRPLVPRQLLPVPAHFTGRARDLRALDALRAARAGGSAPQVAVVSGPAGVGKTALVSRWLSALAPEFPDGQLYADLRGHTPAGPAGPTEALAGFLRALGAASIPGSLAEQAAMWRSLTADLRLVVMLDNALSAAQVRTLLPAAPDSLVVVTSRHRLTGLGVDGAGFHQVGMLDPAAALELFTRGVGGDRVAADRPAAREVVGLCACLPLAVCLAAAQLAARPRRSVAALASALTRGRGPLETLGVEGDTAVRTALDESFATLPAGAADAYRRMGLLPVTRYDGPMVGAVCGVPPEEAEDLLELLLEVNLLEETGTSRVPGARDRYRFHDLVRQHAAGRAETDLPEPERRVTLRRFVDWCLATATAAEALLTPSHRNLPRDYGREPAPPVAFDAQAPALAWLDEHRYDLMAALRLAAREGWDASTWQLVDAMWPLFLRLRPYDLWNEAHALGLAAARRAGHRAGEGRMLTSGGSGLCHTGRFDEGARWFEDALRHATEDGDERQRAQALHGLGRAHFGAGRTRDAEVHYGHALTLREAIGHTRGAALSRVCLGEIALAHDRPDLAAGRLATARAELVAEGDSYDAARALALLGHATARGGDARTGMRRLLRALVEFENAGSVHWQARTMEYLGQACQEHRAPTEAVRWFTRSLALYDPVSPTDAARLRTRLRETGPGPAGAR
ncbi:tetratricopeptide repeat protein [Streptomyces albireticuli]|uniref:tetratricopeptide repeat protein n=1 Tax=Streptomyces albireticuli TaxID=1940 RepID=UPI0036CE6914